MKTTRKAKKLERAEKQLTAICSHRWVVEELKKCEETLSKILIEDDELYKIIVEGILFLDKVYLNTDMIINEQIIKDEVWNRYPNAYTELSQNGNDNIFTPISHLKRLVKGTYYLVKPTLRDAAKAEIPNYYEIYREAMEEKIKHIFYPGDYEDGIQNMENSNEMELTGGVE